MTGFWESILEERADREEAAKDALDAGTHKLCLVAESCPFDCIAITAPNPRASKAYLEELSRRVDGKGTKEVLVLAVSDPEGVRIGSGGGTLNAILEIDESLKVAKASNNEDPQSGGLSASRVLLVHSGGDSQRSPTQCVCGKAWSALNSCGAGGGVCNTPMDLLLDHLARLFGSGLAPGSLVVTACDVMLLIPPEVAATADWSMEGSGGVAGLAIAANAAKYAPNHGVYCLDDGGRVGGEGGKCGVAVVSEYLQKPSFEVAQASGAFLSPDSGNQAPKDPPGTPAPEVAIDSGVVVFSGEATVALAGLAASDAFKGCTANGVAEGIPALRLELYSDLLLALRTGSSGGDEGGLDAYLAACGPLLPQEHPLSNARRETWDAFNAFPLGAMLLRGGTFVHLGTTPELMEMMALKLPDFIESYGLTARAGSFVGAACSVEENPPAVVVNSSLQGAGVVAAEAVVEHCRLEGDGWEIGAGSLISGVRSLAADHNLRLRSGMCLQQTDLGTSNPQEADVTFVVSLFGAKDDIKAHYTASRARVCGATWEAFLAYSGANVEDVWGGVEEADRKLWSARLFPVLAKQQDGNAVTAETVMWMQQVQDLAMPSTSSSAAPPPAPGNAQTSATKAWLAAERLSFKDILARADPGAEFKWRRGLEKEMEVKHPRVEAGGGEPGAGRFRAWDAVALVTPTMTILQAAQRSLGSFAGTNRAFCVPPPDPAAFSANDDPSSKEMMECDGPLVLNALLVVAERYSALKRARFGSETSAAALRGMCVLLCLGAGVATTTGESGMVVAQGVPGTAEPGVWVLERDGTMFFMEEGCIASLLSLSQSDPRYQCLTYLGVDNAMPPSGTSTGGSPPCSTRSAVGFITEAASRASTAAPKKVTPPADVESINDSVAANLVSAAASAVAQDDGCGGGVDLREIPGLKELEMRAADEDCTPAGAAQALARVACRLYEVADKIGGGGHRSGPGEHPEWQAAMRGLYSLRALPGGRGWGVPTALPESVAALMRLRESWLGGKVGASITLNDNAAESSFPNPHLVVRCARHYERAAAVLVSAAVATASLFVESPPADWGNAIGSTAGSSTAGAIPTLDGEGERGAVAEAALSGEPCEGSTNGEGGTGKSSEESELRQNEDQEGEQQRPPPPPQQQASGLTHRQQDMVRHMQVHINHKEIVRKNAQHAKIRMQEERQRWQEQQRQRNDQRHPLPVGASVTSSAAARIDLAGGWTDTPPISYEAGGAVVNAAVTVSGERPVDCLCERIEERRVELVCEGQEGSVYSRTRCSSLKDFGDFCVPHAPAALLKAALICAEIVHLESTPNDMASDSEKSAKGSLDDQLARVFGSGGIRITSRSRLPQGSGMGTSSILAGVVLSAACVAAGRAMSSTSLIHAVLRVEQLMTAGGGHQDQVGGLLGGVKICRTTASLPLQVLCETVPLDPSFEEALNDRLVLVFTGKQRLARDLLQGVVRGWHDRLPETVNTVEGLVANAEDAANACRGPGDLETLGRCLSIYWEQKKRMAPGAEPPTVKALLDKLRPLCHGLSVCGAGGGGFVACITKTPGDQGIEEVTNALTTSSKNASEESTVSVHRGRLDPVGVDISVSMPEP